MTGASTQLHLHVVDDEPLSAKGLAGFLSRKGYRVTMTCDGREAIDAFRVDPADVVITDLRMPRLDGWELIRILRGEFPAVYIIVVTGHYTAADTKKATDAGANVVMRKPLDLRAIIRTLESLAREAG